MPVNLNLPQAAPVAGVEWVTLAAGIKTNGSTDMVVARLAEGATCSSVFTKSAFSAAPVTICRQHMKDNGGAVRVLLINSGNANAGTGEPGIEMALGHCSAIARAMSVPVSSVLPFSTGVIGQLLPDDVMLAGIVKACDILQAGDTTHIEAWQSAARGIMTTDTQPKLTSQTVDIAGPVSYTHLTLPTKRIV